MIKRTFVLLGTIIFLLYLLFMYNNSTSIFLFVFALLCMICSIAFCIFEKHNVNVSLQNYISTAEQNQTVPIKIDVSNESRLFPMHLCMFLQIRNTLTGEKTKIKKHIFIAANSKETVLVSISSKNSGNICITLKKIKIYDLLKVMVIGKRINQNTNIIILPKLHLFPIEVTRKTRDFISEAEEHSDRESGDDPADIYQIREYKKEDSMHDIHWKLSAKNDNLMVKDYGKPLSSSVLIRINSACTEKKKKRRLFKKNKHDDIMDMLEIVSSISLSLFQEKCIHTVAWYEHDKGTIYRKKIVKEINIYEMINRLSFIEIFDDEEMLKAYFADSFRGDNYSTIIDININGEIRINQLPIDIPKKKNSIEWNKMALTV